MKKESRRDFIKKGVAGITGAVLAPSVLQNKYHSNFCITKEDYVYRTLGRTGLKLPVVSMGGPENPVLLKAALDKGIIHINTSPDYRNGNQERMIGQTLKGVPRDSYVIATGFSMWRKARNQVKNYTKEMIIGSLEASLSRLGLEYTDIYYLMGAAERETVLHAPFIEAMQSFKKNGKVRFIGLTAHENEPEVLYAAVESKIYDVVLTAHNFRKIYRDEIKKAIGAAAEAGVGVIAMKTQAGVYWDHKKKDKINMEAALKWVLRDENVCTAVPEFANVEELNSGISVMQNLRLTTQEKQDMRLDDETSHSGLLCQHCRFCLSQEGVYSTSTTCNKHRLSCKKGDIFFYLLFSSF